MRVNVTAWLATNVAPAVRVADRVIVWPRDDVVGPVYVKVVAALKVAVTDVAAVTVSVHVVAAPVQPPDQPVN